MGGVSGGGVMGGVSGGGVSNGRGEWWRSE